MKNAPLSGLTVIDFSRILAGPLCTQLLSDAGARVIKVEEVARGDETRRWGPPFAGPESAYFLSVNRNKESLTLNLKHRKGRRIARQLVRTGDVVIHNFRDDHAREFGLTPAAVRRQNRRAVHCQIRGFERGTAEERLPGYDLLAQAAGGLMAITGDPDGDPMKVGVALSDVLTAHHAHGAILGALLERAVTGRGSAVEVSLVGATAASLVNVAQNFLVTGHEPKRYGNQHPSIVPYQLFAASDRTFVLAVANDRHFEVFAREVIRDRPLASDPRFRTNADRVRHRDELIPRLERIFARKMAAHWVGRCHDAGIPASTVQSFSELFSGAAAPLLQSVRHSAAGEIQLLRNPVRRDGRLARVRSAPPLVGAHSAAILRELGYSAPQIEALREEGVI